MPADSKKTLIDLIKHNGTISVNDLVEHTGLSKTSVREHLLQLERDGEIERDYVRSGRGRPSLEFRLTSKAERFFPSAEVEMFRKLLRHLIEEGHEETLQNFFETYWQDRLQKAKIRMDTTSEKAPHARLYELQAFLVEEGFMAELEVDEEQNRITIRECNCPFREVVKETRLPCRLEEKFYQELLHPEAKRTAYIADGDFSCTYQVPLKQNQE
jgi:predicted ArsR family transcriptional regulator